MPLILGTNSIKDTGYNVANSCRFDGSSAYMTLTPGSAGSQVTQTYSVWVKRSKLGDEEFIFYARKDADDDTRLYFENDTLRFQCTVDNTTHTRLWTNRVFRDPSAWYHIVISYDSSVSTPSTSSVQMFINGVKETSFSATIYPSQNDVSYWCDDALHTVGRRSDGTSNYYNGYMAEAVLIDGLALTASSFGEFDEDSPTIWKPKDVSGLTFGTNGFYLDFEASDNLGNDANGGTDFSESGLAATDQATDTPTNNFATLNPLAGSLSSGVTVTEGNLNLQAASYWRWLPSTICPSNGKWYYEVLMTGSDPLYEVVGVTPFVSWKDIHGETIGSGAGGEAESVGYSKSGNVIQGNSTVYSGTSYAVDDIVCVAVDLDNRKIYFRKNDAAWENSGDPTSGATGTGAVALSATLSDWSLSTSAAGADAGSSVNYGSPAFTISSGNADGNGYGNFEHAPPSGYYALCTKNLAEYG